jgi:hypothetical protein
MSILKQIIKTQRQNDLIDESAAGGAVSAGAVAGFRAPLGADPKSFQKRSKKKRKTRMRRRTVPGTSFYFVESIEDEKFDSSDVISKLKKAEKKATYEDDTKGFALEDDNGQIVKVYVAAEQAEEFERALGAALNGSDSSEDEVGSEGQSTQLEIAEVLFNLKDRFTIVDVDWPEIEEDEEQEVAAPGDEGAEGAEGDEGELGDPEGDLDLDLEGGEGADEEGGMEADLQLGDEGDVMGGEGDMTGMLSSVIDLLKSQADAQKAEAQAKEAEANATEAKYNAQAAESKVRQEEEVLDMEAYYDDQSKQEKEAKQLAKLAKWKHETAQKATNKLKGDSGKFKMPEGKSEEDNEEVGMWHNTLPGDEIPGNKFEWPGADENRDKNLKPGEFIKYLLKSVQGN